MNPQTQSKQNIYRIAFIILVIVVAGYLYFTHARTTTEVSTTATTTATSTNTGKAVDLSKLPVGATTTINGYTVTVLPNTASGAIPDYKKALVFAASIPVSERSAIQSQFAQAQSAIAADNGKDFNEWIALGNARKNAGDYAGAVIDWQYALKVYPGNVVSNANLGDLYTNYTHDYSKAVAAYKAQIAINPTDISIYNELFKLYTNQFPQSSTVAIDVLNQGIKANPKAVNLQVILARYYKTLGRTADAKTEYNAAISNAQSQGQTALAAQIQQEAIQ